MLTTNQKGLIAETAVIHECAKLGIPVSKPLDDQRYDLIFDLEHSLLRVQCKWAQHRGRVLIVPLYSTRRTAGGVRRTYYSPSELDAFAAYAPATGLCYFASFDEIGSRQALHLRLEPTMNNQVKGIRWARDHEFAATIGRLGAVAQLGERLAGSQ
jgi:PD-(D/E)XK nuclease superfamily protein